MEITNINRSIPDFSMEFDSSVSSGLTFSYDWNSETGGSLRYSLDDGEEVDITENEVFALGREGKYVFTYVAASGARAESVTWYVTYGAEKAHLADVSVGADGTVTVTEKARAAATSALYLAGSDTPNAQLKADKAGKYFLVLESGGDKEIVVFSVAASGGGDPGAPATEAEEPENGNNMAILIAGVVIGGAALLSAAIVCPLLIVKGRKRI